MRKKDREITNFEEIEEILNKNNICRLGMVNKSIPYVIPISYGYKDRIFYFHTGYNGLKIEILKKNPEVCIEIDQNIHIISGITACKYSVAYQSINVFGKAEFIENMTEKTNALNIIMKNATQNEDWDYTTEIVQKTCIIKVPIREIFGKKKDEE